MEFTRSIVIIAAGFKITPDMPQELQRVLGGQINRTLGTGLLLSFESSKYLLTCRHVIDSMPADETLKAIATELPVLNMGEYRAFYHPMENDRQSVDIALVEIGGPGCEQLPFISYQGKSSLPILHPGTPIEIYGFPANRIKPGSPPRGDLQRLDAQHFVSDIFVPPVNLVARPLYLEMARINMAHNDIAGMSGGLVVATVDNKRVPYGMMIGDISGRADGNPITVARFISFANIFMR